MLDTVALRLNAAFYKAAEIVLLEGAAPHEVDEALVAFGFEMGPFERQDLSGLDVAYEARKSGLEEQYPHLFGLIISDRMVQEGKLGKKVNAGWYRYPGGNGKVEDPIVEDLVIEESYFAGIERHEFSGDEIVLSILAGVINEAYRLLDEQESLSLIEIDKEADKAFAYPSGKAGLMKYADTLDVSDVQTTLCRMSKIYESFCKPANGLAAAVKQNVSL